jgi:iron complex transport system substrate-binding protein
MLHDVPNIGRLLAMAFLLAVVCGCPKPKQAATGPVIVDATGESVPLEPLPGRVVSFAPVITAEVCSLKMQDRLVGVTRFCKLPPGETKTVIGDLLNQDAEQVIRLSPDLILATKEGNVQDQVVKLRKLGLRVFVVGEANSWGDIKTGFSQIAKLLGRTPEADAMIAALQQRLDTVAIRVCTLRQVFVQLSDQYHTVGEGTFVDDAIRQAGGVNIARKAIGRWPMLSVEEIIRQDPDLIVTLAGDLMPSPTETWRKYPQLKAVKNGRVIVVDGDMCCQPTPENFVRLVETISENLR